MKNILKTLTDIELRNKITECRETLVFQDKVVGRTLVDYNKMSKKWRVNPAKYVALKEKYNSELNTYSLLKEYFECINAESIKRINKLNEGKISKNTKKHGKK